MLVGGGFEIIAQSGATDPVVGGNMATGSFLLIQIYRGEVGQRIIIFQLLSRIQVYAIGIMPTLTKLNPTSGISFFVSALKPPSCTNDYDTSIGISGNNNQMDGLVDQHNRCRFSSTCTNEGSFISDLPAGNSGSLNMIDNQNNVCSNGSKCTNDSNNNPGSSSQRNVCDSGSTCANSGVNNVNQCVNGTVCTNSGDAPVGSFNLKKCVDGALCTNSGQNTNVTSNWCHFLLNALLALLQHAYQDSRR